MGQCIADADARRGLAAAAAPPLDSGVITGLPETSAGSARPARTDHRRRGSRPAPDRHRRWPRRRHQELQLRHGRGAGRRRGWRSCSRPSGSRRCAVVATPAHRPARAVLAADPRGDRGRGPAMSIQSNRFEPRRRSGEGYVARFAAAAALLLFSSCGPAALGGGAGGTTGSGGGAGGGGPADTGTDAPPYTVCPPNAAIRRELRRRKPRRMESGADERERWRLTPRARRPGGARARDQRSPATSVAASSSARARRSSRSPANDFRASHGLFRQRPRRPLGHRARRAARAEGTPGTTSASSTARSCSTTTTAPQATAGHGRAQARPSRRRPGCAGSGASTAPERDAVLDRRRALAPGDRHRRRLHLRPEHHHLGGAGLRTRSASARTSRSPRDTAMQLWIPYDVAVGTGVGTVGEAPVHQAGDQREPVRPRRRKGPAREHKAKRCRRSALNL